MCKHVNNYVKYVCACFALIDIPTYAQNVNPSWLNIKLCLTYMTSHHFTCDIPFKVKYALHIITYLHAQT